MAKSKFVILWGFVPLFLLSFLFGIINAGSVLAQTSPTAVPATPTVTPTRPPEPTPTAVPPNPTATPPTGGATSENTRQGTGGTTILILLGILILGFSLAVIIPLVRIRMNRR
jgi:hypothetical protein